MENAEKEKIDVEVCYALRDQQTVIGVKLNPGATVEEAILHSEILDKHPEIDLKTGKVGVFGKLVKPDAPLQTGDRVEIYRPLIADPKESRRQKAAADKQEADKSD